MSAATNQIRSTAANHRAAQTVWPPRRLRSARARADGARPDTARRTLAGQWIDGRRPRRRMVHGLAARRGTSPRWPSTSRGLQRRSSLAATSACGTHLRAVAAPGERPDVLAELVGEELASWPPRGMARHRRIRRDRDIAETQNGSSRHSSTSSPVQLFVASRQRPSWATQRRILWASCSSSHRTSSR